MVFEKSELPSAASLSGRELGVGCAIVLRLTPASRVNTRAVRRERLMASLSPEKTARVRSPRGLGNGSGLIEEFEGEFSPSE